MSAVRTGAKLLTRDSAALAGTRGAGLGEPCVTERAVAGAGERVALVLDRLPVAPRPAPRITPATAVQPGEDVLVPRVA